MTRPSKKLPCETSAALAAFKDATRHKAANERMDEIEKRFMGVMRGFEAKLRLLEEDNRSLKTRVLMLETGARAPGDRRKAMYNLVASCGNGTTDAG